nr:MAG TPA: Protein of unknown function (DUF669) [Caudoviricetes sp.]
MVAMGFNFSEVEDMSFEALPAGTYHASIFEAEEKEGKQYPYLSIQFNILDGHDKNGNSARNRRVFSNYSYSPKALFSLKGLLVATDIWTTEELNAPGFEFSPSDLIGKVVKITLGTRTYQDELQNVVKNAKLADEDFDPTAEQAPSGEDTSLADAPSLEADLPFEVE